MCVKESHTKAVLLETLAQLSPTAPSKAGGGAKPTNTAAKHPMYKRAGSKYVTQGIVMQLQHLNSPLHNAYVRTMFCNSFLLQEGNTITAKYCNSRWCLVCNRIRTAKLINGYGAQLEELTEKRFATLTRRAVSAEDLPDTLRQMDFAFTKIRKKLHKAGYKLKGIRKLECEYNDIEKTYNPHYHCIFEGQMITDALIDLWLDEMGDNAQHWAQRNTPCDSGSMKEIFKYATKMAVGSRAKKGKYVPARAMDIIYRAFHKKRLIRAYGLKKKVSEDVEELESQVVEELNAPPELAVCWKWEGHDWYRFGNKEPMTNFIPTFNQISIKTNTS